MEKDNKIRKLSIYCVVEHITNSANTNHCNSLIMMLLHLDGWVGFFWLIFFSILPYKMWWKHRLQPSRFDPYRRRWTPVPWCHLFSAAWPTTPTFPRAARSTRRLRTMRRRHRARNLSRYESKSMDKFTHIIQSCHTYFVDITRLITIHILEYDMYMKILKY